MKPRNFKLCKPYGYLSQFTNNQNTRRNKKLLGELYEFPEGTMAIGRLDEDSEGLLLLTTDGAISEAVRSKKVEKQYYVQVDGLINEAALKQLSEGVEINVNGTLFHTDPCEVFQLMELPMLPPRKKKIRDARHGPTTWVSITLKQGKFRQVRKMTAAVGYPTLRLVRVRIGEYHLGSMVPGEVQEIQL